GSTRSVSYRGVQFDVPSDWPVYDLEADPSTCVRFDVHAVYLGAGSADMQCPAGIVGRAEAIQVQAADPNVQPSASATGMTTQDLNGLSADVSAGPDANELDVAFPAAGVVATITYRDTDVGAQQILHSFRAVGS
ncbi:MAG TPA: hypothetical protein VGA62_07115, partial [Acidimicrobiia bacterium]